MQPLKPAKIEACRKRLEDLRWILTREYWKEREASLESSSRNPEDLIDLAERSYARDFLLSLSEMDRKQLFLIEDALGRIRGGTYGVCSHCGGHIPESRLDAVPWARHCIVCQGLQEEGLLPRLAFSGGRAA